MLPRWHTPLTVKLPDWLRERNPLSGGVIFSGCVAIGYITLGSIGIGCANTKDGCSPVMMEATL
jgi:hypothetical protein